MILIFMGIDIDNGIHVDIVHEPEGACKVSLVVNSVGRALVLIDGWHLGVTRCYTLLRGSGEAAQPFNNPQPAVRLLFSLTHKMRSVDGGGGGKDENMKTAT